MIFAFSLLNKIANEALGQNIEKIRNYSMVERWFLTMFTTFRQKVNICVCMYMYMLCNVWTIQLDIEYTLCPNEREQVGIGYGGVVNALVLYVNYVQYWIYTNIANTTIIVGIPSWSHRSIDLVTLHHFLVSENECQSWWLSSLFGISQCLNALISIKVAEAIRHLK